jgi:hypothetical protein
VKLHCCLIDKDCRQYGVPPRLHLDTRWFHAAIALRPSARFAHFTNDDTIKVSWTLIRKPNRRDRTLLGRKS